MNGTRIFGFVCAALLAAPMALAGEDGVDRPWRLVAPLEIPHSTNLYLDSEARRHQRHAGNVERSGDFLDFNPGFSPLTWPRNGDMRARLLTPGLRRTPVVGWMAASLYRSRKETGWCLEVDPGEGEYLVFYRRNFK